jgi:DUF2934 family protein
MAKRTTPRAEANDATAAPSSRARSRRTPVNSSPEAGTSAAYPGIERSEDDGAVAQAATNPASGSSQSFRSPSDDEIRDRAYHRYLERGAHQGSELDDWVEAERELKTRR